MPSSRVSMRWASYFCGVDICVVLRIPILYLRRPCRKLLKVLPAGPLLLRLALPLHRNGFRFRSIEVISFAAAFYAGIYCLVKG